MALSEEGLEQAVRSLERLAPEAAREEQVGEAPVARIVRLAGAAARRFVDRARHVEESEARLESVLEMVSAMAALDFTCRAPVSDRADSIDALAAGVNMLQEELQHSMVSREYLDDIMRSMSDMLIVVGGDGRIGTVNDSVCRALGYERQELVGRLWGEVCPHAQEIAACSRQAGGARTRESELVRSDGERVPVSCSCSPLSSATGEVGRWVCAAQDIGERKRAQQQIEASLRLLQTLINTIPNPVYYTDTEGVYLGCNETFGRVVLGLGREQIVGRRLFDLPEQVPAGLARLSQERDEELLKAGTLQNYELPVRCADGALRDYHFSRAVYRDARGQPAGIVGVMLDISQRKASERFMLEQSGFNALRGDIWRLAAEDIDEVEVVQGVVDRVGPALGFGRVCYHEACAGRDGAEVFRTVREWCDEGVPSLVGVEIPRALVEPMLGSGTVTVEREATLAQMPEPYRGQLAERYERERSEFGTEHVTFAPLRLGGQVEGVFTFDTAANRPSEAMSPRLVEQVLQEMLSIVSSVFARRRAERSLQQAKGAAEELAARAQEASMAKSEFVSVVSHEIRTPLTAVVGMTEALRMSGVSEEQEEMLGVMRDAEDMLMGLLNGVLDLSRAETGRIVLEEAPLDVRALVEQRCQMIAGQVEAKGVALGFSVDGAVPAQLLGDGLRLGQVLTNLLGNAAKFTDSGSIEVRVERVGSGEGWCEVRFVVSDTGVGIPAEKLESVFDVFTQADVSTTRKYGGSGLGLAICRRLVELMGGSISAASDVGGGSTFEFAVRLRVPPSVQ